MYDPLYAQVIAWVGLALLLVLCLPFARIQKLVLEVCTWVLRLALLALLAAAVYLWFRPGDLPVQVTDTLSTFPSPGGILPRPGTQHFGVCVASCLVAALLPLLTVLDVSRKLAGWRLRQLRAVAAEPKAAEETPAPQPRPAPVAHRVDRRAAAATLAGVGARKPAHTANHTEP
jgi:hypothetical protein